MHFCVNDLFIGVDTAKETHFTPKPGAPCSNLVSSLLNGLQTKRNHGTGLKPRSLIKALVLAYYPVGLVAPFFMTTKVLQQWIWLVKVQWHDNLPEDLRPSGSAPIVSDFGSSCNKTDLRDTLIPAMLVHKHTVSWFTW